jgi:factor associated with neutral sphingomyelinase activation
VARRRYQLQNTAIELSLKGSAAAVMYHFQSPTDCDVVWRHLSLRLQTDELREWEKIRTAWQAGAVSNYHYLMYVNSMGDRSLNDLAQYPVLPWVLADYTSETLDLQSPAAFRDLSKPMGALYQPRLARLVQRYHAMARPKFLYGTHYSAPALVLYYLVRSAPQQCLRLHGGKLDLPDRMFHSIQATWHACTTHDADVKELIPEFFNGKGDFLVNRHGLHLGMTQEGQRVSDVALPPWAQGSPAQFVALNRRALESETVSQDIHRWIDLIFGYKQRGEMSKLAFNVFHPLTYEGEVDIHSLQDETERYAVMQQISEFGQTPKQLFTEPHPRRGTGPAVPAAPTALYRYAPERAGIGRGGEEESGRRRAEIGGWGARALEQAALDQAAAVIMGAAPARTGSSQWQENEEGDEGGETGAGNAYYLRPLVEGSDSDVEPRNWTAHVSERRGIVPLTLPRLLLALAVRVLDSVSPFLSCRVGGSTDVRL